MFGCRDECRKGQRTGAYSHAQQLPPPPSPHSPHHGVLTTEVAFVVGERAVCVEVAQFVQSDPRALAHDESQSLPAKSPKLFNFENQGALHLPKINNKTADYQQESNDGQNVSLKMDEIPKGSC
ncbi:hypothetical protein EYF80_019849 [Liparis tanakae]|uniref:Uncharacterized protein n=1 Tax=Liparis tanakae TaxID=230148 RepID=A0A4Z2HVU9_9TELE|nr:hypothetical protein EYF80_019849 [Liparis tanakae]